MRTPDEITTGIYKHIKASELSSVITGNVINGRDRNPNSDVEDVVIKMLSGSPGQVQTAVVNVNIYVSDVLKDGQYVKDDDRVPLLERAAMDLFQNPFDVDGARVSIESQTTFESQSGNEHIINNRLLYELINED